MSTIWAKRKPSKLIKPQVPKHGPSTEYLLEGGILEGLPHRTKCFLEQVGIQFLEPCTCQGLTQVHTLSQRLNLNTDLRIVVTVDDLNRDTPH